jgi:hypothetical protein
MADKETQGGLSPPSPEERRRLVVAFMRIQNAALRDEIINLVEMMSRIDKYSESLGSFSTRPWRKVRTITSSVQMRFWVEAGLAALSGFLAILTLFSGSVRQVQQKAVVDWLVLCGFAKVGFLVLSEVVHVEVAVGFEPVFVGLDG